MRFRTILLTTWCGLSLSTSLEAEVTAIRFSRLLPMSGPPVADAVVVDRRVPR